MDSPCDYEEERARRIAENMKRLAELGVVESSIHMLDRTRDEIVRSENPKCLQILTGVPRSPKPRRRPDEPVRRSGRLDGKPPRSYSEDPAPSAAASREVRKLKGGGGVSRSVRERVTSADEVYSQAHVDSLGTHSQPWELFVDGYDLASGRRLYDAVRGATCHQCRQKTLGTHTSCDRCGRLSGIFCGDCLFMRYGENVREANAAREAARARREEARRRRSGAGAAAAGAAAGEAAAAEGEDDQDHGWVCPPCRGLCNCSFHRARRGWAPTGSLYRYALAEGYASVAHYLVLTNLGEGVVVPPGLRQARSSEVAAGAAGTAAAAARRPVSAAAVPDPPVTTTVARGGKPRQSKSKGSPAQGPGSPMPMSEAKQRASKGAAAARRRRSLESGGRPSPDAAAVRFQLTSPALEPAPVVVATAAANSLSLLPNGKRRTGSFMSQLRLNPEALKRRKGGGATAAAKKKKKKAGAKGGGGGATNKKKPAPSKKKAVVSVSPREPRVSRRSARGSEVAAAAC